jgi:hypothetical protein
MAEMEFPFNVNYLFKDVISLWTAETLKSAVVLRGNRCVYVYLYVLNDVISLWMAEAHTCRGVNVQELMTS